MNKTISLLGLSIVIAFTSCCERCDERLYHVEATFYFINETSSIITNDFSDEFDDILPNSAAIMKEERVMQLLSRPTIDDYSPVINTRTFFYKEGDILLCEFDTRDITNYENRKEVEDLIFEFTFRFTEEKKAQAQECL